MSWRILTVVEIQDDVIVLKLPRRPFAHKGKQEH
jgi:hypothetical protein